MSYYEFKDYPDSHCLILNSVQMVSRATEYDWSRFAEVVLALDTDAAGMKGKVQLAKFFLEKYPHIKIKVDHPPIVEMDWNDYLRDQKKKG